MCIDRTLSPMICNLQVASGCQQSISTTLWDEKGFNRDMGDGKYKLMQITVEEK